MAAMRRFLTIAAAAALLTSFFEAPYFHLHNDHRHNDAASDHVRRQHLGMALTVHSHFPGQSAGLPLGRRTAQTKDGAAGDDAAIFLAQASGLAPRWLPASLSQNEWLPTVAEPILHVVVLTAHRSHDPPFIPFVSPRSPPA
jgi:hypothetical protein